MRNLRRAGGLLAFLFVLAVAAAFAVTALRVSFSGTESEMAAARAAADAAGVPLASWKTLVVAASGSVGAPAEEVWARFSRIEEWPRWSSPLHLGARWKGEPGFRVAGGFEEVVALGFPVGTIRSEEFVTRLKPGREVMWCRSEGGIASCHVWRFTPVTPERTHVVNVEVLHGAPVGFLAPLVQSRWSRLFQQSVSGLARAAEAAPRGIIPQGSESMPHVRPVVAITLGDPASVGPEVVVKALAAGELSDVCVPVVVGDPRAVERALATTGAALEVVPVARPADATGARGLAEVVDVPARGLDGIAWGRVQADAGRAAFESIRAAIGLALAREVDAVATAPVNKEAFRAAGVAQIGHTEIFGELTGTPDPLTLFEVKALRIFFLSRHVSLADAIRRITAERVASGLTRAAAALRTLGVASPTIALAALNPHGGEHGLFGDEEEQELVPAVERARAAGVDARGPYPADSVFWHAAEGRFDAVLSLYHDQGHIAAKMYDFERTVSITCGLPFLRTSVDHGTAFDIAGTGRASAVSMVEAVRAAARYAFAVRPREG